MAESPIRWAANGDAAVAYRTLGEGAFDIVFVSGLISHLEVLFEEPGIVRWFERLGQIGRVILMDRRGSGLSDPIPPGFTVEEEVRDVEAVLDAVGSQRAVVMAYAAGGAPALAFAAMRPERTLALVLYACMVSSVADDEITWALNVQEREERFAFFADHWGTGVNLETMAPSVVDDERMRAWLARMERLSTNPNGLRRIQNYLGTIDVKPQVSSIRVPSLVLHRTDDRMIDVRHSRYLAERLPGAKLVEVPGIDSLPMVGDAETLLEEIEEFLTGGRGSREPQRALLTVLFTDVVDATGHAARLGDARWRDLLATHDRKVRECLRSYSGHEVKTVGDAFLATFDGAPSGAVRCARSIRESMSELGIEVRVGLHTGECEIVGDDVGGMAVHIAARVSALAAAGEVLASGTTYGTVVGSGLAFEERGMRELKGVPGKWPIFALAGA